MYNGDMTRAGTTENRQMHQVILHYAGRSEVYGTYATKEQAEQIAAGLRQVWWATATMVDVRAK